MPEKFAPLHVGSLKFDPKHVGFKNAGAFEFDTTLPGNRNTGPHLRDKKADRREPLGIGRVSEDALESFGLKPRRRSHIWERFFLESHRLLDECKSFP
jgi:hypothetical protein